jgi:small subunit ribosomal protein S21
LIVRDKESIQEAVRRFRKLVERSGIKKEMRRREYYEKPSEIRRRARLRAERRARRTTTPHAGATGVVVAGSFSRNYQRARKTPANWGRRGRFLIAGCAGA